MTKLLESAPFTSRADATFLAELRALTRHHRAGCQEYARMTSDSDFESLEEAPALHVGLFKRLDLRTSGFHHRRVLLSSATSTGSSSKIALDERSSALQSRSVVAILSDWIGARADRPLIVIDSAESLRSRGVSARIAAALSLKPLSSELFFVAGSRDVAEIDWGRVARVVDQHDEVIVYGFTWLLWYAWAVARIPDHAACALAKTKIHFVHSGGWKKLEANKIDREAFTQSLLSQVGPGSTVVDYYGLVEQVGVIYPECIAGYRHVPRWADVLVRDVYNGASVHDAVGVLQLVNVLAWGAPYHNVLTEDLGRIVSGACPCGREAKRFELLGRLPRAEIRGCANV